VSSGRTRRNVESRGRPLDPEGARPAIYVWFRRLERMRVEPVAVLKAKVNPL